MPCAKNEPYTARIRYQVATVESFFNDIIFITSTDFYRGRSKCPLTSVSCFSKNEPINARFWNSVTACFAQKMSRRQLRSVTRLRHKRWFYSGSPYQFSRFVFPNGKIWRFKLLPFRHFLIFLDALWNVQSTGFPILFKRCPITNGCFNRKWCEFLYISSIFRGLGP